jgi:hypothetical protein
MLLEAAVFFHTIQGQSVYCSMSYRITAKTTTRMDGWAQLRLRSVQLELLFVVEWTDASTRM